MKCLNFAQKKDLILISFISCWLKATTAKDLFKYFEMLRRGSNTMVKHSNTDLETQGSYPPTTKNHFIIVKRFTLNKSSLLMKIDLQSAQTLQLY